ncbi:MAG TPA: Spy/CpxP family protein refolding chaperone [Planctomycetota bacterium]
MKTWALWVSMAAVAAAQDRGTEFRVNQLKSQLGLSDEQTSKVKEILDKDTEQIRALLTDEQKTKFDELRQRGGAGGGAGGNRQGNFQFGGGRGLGGGMQLDNLKQELQLTDEQAEKIKPIVDEFQAQTQKRMEELRANGFQGLDWQAELAKGQESMKAFSEKVKAHLTDEQKTKADALMERATGWMRMIPGVVQRFQGGGAAATPTRASAEERVKKALDALKIEKDDERAAVKDLLEKAIKAQDALDDFLKSSRDSLGAAAGNKDLSNEALEDKLTEQRKERRRLEKDLKDAQDALADVVSSRQELELVRQGVLR